MTAYTSDPVSRNRTAADKTPTPGPGNCLTRFLSEHLQELTLHHLHGDNPHQAKQGNEHGNIQQLAHGSSVLYRPAPGARGGSVFVVRRHNDPVANLNISRLHRGQHLADTDRAHNLRDL